MKSLSLMKIAFMILAFCFTTVVVSSAQTFTTLVRFDGTDGAYPLAGLAQGTDGDLYGTTFDGGRNFCKTIGSCGTVFKTTPTGTLTVLHSFDDIGPAFPSAGLVQATDGNFYGTTNPGGADTSCVVFDSSVASCGTVFKITPAGTLTTLHSFSAVGEFSGNSDGGNPDGALVQATDGDFYGTTYTGGIGDSGTVFKITPAGTLTTLYSFCPQGVTVNCPDGGNPAGGLVQASDGNFYGTTNGGFSNSGTFFKITAAGALTTLYVFCTQTSCTDGSGPRGTLVQGTDGNFYGTTSAGGDINFCPNVDAVSGCGTVFKITPAGVLTTLHTFTNGTDGAYPAAGLVQATDGDFYGTTSQAGANGAGMVFKITTAGTLTTLYSFCSQTNCTDGGNPAAGLVQATDGDFYGTTSQGGAGIADGTVFSLSVGLSPFVTFIRNSGIVGAKAQILGQGFEDATAVSFNGTPARFEVVSDTFMTATVPAGATTGDLTVTERTGTLTSNKVFRVPPTTQDFVPNNGAVGTVVIIHGMSLKQTTAVSFDGVPTTSFSVVSNTELQATVPAGAKTGFIEITTAGGSFTTCNKFYVTP